MNKGYALIVLAAVLSGCTGFLSAKREPIEWPDEAATQLLVPSVEAGAGLAAAAAIREMVRTNPYPDLFRGCTSPEQGLDVSVFKDPKSGLYFVVVSQHFNRCGGPRVRVLDGWYEYAVTPQGEVVGEAPPLAAEESPRLPEQTPPPVLVPDKAEDNPAPPPILAPPVGPEEPTPGTQLPASPPSTPPEAATSAALAVVPEGH